MVRNGKALLWGVAAHGGPRSHCPIVNPLDCEVKEHGVSHGLAEVGYDIRLKQQVDFIPAMYHITGEMTRGPYTRVDGVLYERGNFTLASAIEEFDMPTDLMGIVHDKSTWARKGLSVFNTVIEPGFKGGLTLELVFHGNTELIIPAGAGIAQVIFHEISCNAQYTGKYQGQSSDPEEARFD